MEGSIFKFNVATCPFGFFLVWGNFLCFFPLVGTNLCLSLITRSSKSTFSQRFTARLSLDSIYLSKPSLHPVIPFFVVPCSHFQHPLSCRMFLNASQGMLTIMQPTRNKGTGVGEWKRETLTTCKSF